MEQQKPKVLYIIGEGRSGSTLLDMVLGQHQALTAVGELRFIWERGVLDSQLCGCGNSFTNCTFWGEILEAFFSDFDCDASTINHARRLDSMISLPRLWLSKHFGLGDGSTELLIKSYERLYSIILESTGSEFVIDASKSIPFAYIMSQSKAIDFYFLHLVRNPCAVAYSRQKKKIRTEIVGREEYMPQVSTVKSALKWLSNNYLASKVIGDFPLHTLTYEDFVSDTHQAVREIESFLELESESLCNLFDNEGFVNFETHHTVSGNPSRFADGAVKLKLDNAWCSEMPLAGQRIVNAIAYPVYKKYYKS